MNVDQLKANLTQAICEGYGNYIVNFCDQDGDSITIDCVYLDDDGDVCLESNEVDNKDYTVQELIDILDRYRDSRYVYVYDDDYDLDFDIDDEDDDDDDDENYDHLWYIEDDCLYIDTYYEENN